MILVSIAVNRMHVWDPQLRETKTVYVSEYLAVKPSLGLIFSPISGVYTVYVCAILSACPLHGNSGCGKER